MLGLPLLHCDAHIASLFVPKFISDLKHKREKR